VRRCAIHGVTAPGEPLRVGGMCSVSLAFKRRIQSCFSASFSLTQQSPSVFGTAHPLRRRPYFATAAFSHNTTRSDFIEGLGLLTAARVKYIRFPLSWRLR